MEEFAAVVLTSVLWKTIRRREMSDSVNVSIAAIDDWKEQSRTCDDERRAAEFNAGMGETDALNSLPLKEV